MFFVIDGGVKLLQAKSTYGTGEHNAELLIKAAADPVFRLPWRDDTKAMAFQAEMGLSGHGNSILGCLFSADAYFAANPDVARAGFDALRRYLTFGAHEDRPLIARERAAWR